MTDYARIVTIAELSEAADYSQPFDRIAQTVAATPAKMLRQRHAATTTGITIELGGFTSLTSLLVLNRSTTLGMIAKHTYTKASMTAGLGDINFNNSNPDTIQSLSQNFTTLGFVVGGYARVSGSANPANSGTWLIQQISAGFLTLLDSAALIAATPDGGAPTIACDVVNWTYIAPSSSQQIFSVRPNDDLVLYSASSTVNAEVWALGA
jgi:hypothetical protein